MRLAIRIVRHLYKFNCRSNHNVLCSSFLGWAVFDWFKSETIIESSVDLLEISHSAGSSGVSPLGFHAPVELSDSFLWVGA